MSVLITQQLSSPSSAICFSSSFLSIVVVNPKKESKTSSRKHENRSSTNKTKKWQLVFLCEKMTSFFLQYMWGCWSDKFLALDKFLSIQCRSFHLARLRVEKTKSRIAEHKQKKPHPNGKNIWSKTDWLGRILTVRIYSYIPSWGGKIIQERYQEFEGVTFNKILSDKSD